MAATRSPSRQIPSTEASRCRVRESMTDGCGINASGLTELSEIRKCREYNTKRAKSSAGSTGGIWAGFSTARVLERAGSVLPERSKKNQRSIALIRAKESRIVQQAVWGHADGQDPSRGFPPFERQLPVRLRADRWPRKAQRQRRDKLVRSAKSLLCHGQGIVTVPVRMATFVPNFSEFFERFLMTKS